MSSVYRGAPEPARADAAPRPILAGRLQTGMSQEEMAAFLHIDPRTLRRYEYGDLPTPDDIMVRLHSEFGFTDLLYRHLKGKYEVPNEIMPELGRTSLSTATLGLLHELNKIEKGQIASELLRLVADGEIDPDEENDFAQIMRDLDGVVKGVFQMKFARKDGT